MDFASLHNAILLLTSGVTGKTTAAGRTGKDMAAAVLLACFVLIWIPKTRTETVSFRDRGLTSIPFDQINNQVTTLQIAKNNISVVDTFIFYPDLETLWFGSNLLSIFPNLCNLNSSLEQLGLKSNYITHIPPERLDCLVSLRTLGLAENKLSSFPAVSGPGKSLTYLSIEYNRFEEFPDLTGVSENLRNVLAGYNQFDTINRKKLKTPKIVPLKLELSGNSNLTTISNLGFWNLKHLDVKGIGLTCDSSIGWIKMVETAGLVVKIDSKPCASLSKLITREWTDIQLQELLRQGIMQFTNY